MTTVLLVPGAFSFGNTDSVRAAFGGPQSLLTQLGDNSNANVVPVQYNDWDTINGATNGAQKIDAAMHAVDPAQKIVVVGHSYGAVSNCVWLRTLGLTSTLDPSRITFVNAANSIRPGGAGAQPSGLSSELWLYLPVGPVSTKWKVYDCAREFDKWADYPNVSTSAYYWQALGNVGAGDNASTTVAGVPNNIHNSYQNVSLTDPAAVSHVVGNVTFMLFKTTPLPNAGGATWAQINTAYNRICTPNWTN